MSDPVGDIGRFAEPSLFILASLSEGPKHGYAIMVDVEAISGQRLGPGTLYAALARLERRGLIEALEPEDRRRPYKLTGLGATTLKALLTGLSTFARTGLDRLGGPGMSRLLALYPRAWRSRYGVEFAELLAARPPSVRDRVDIVIGAIDARVNPQVPGADDRERALAGDRAARIAAIATGVLLTIWAVILASVMVPWDSGLEPQASAAIMTVAFLSEVLANLSALIAFGIVVVRYERILGSAGVAGAILTPVGLLMAGLGMGMLALVTLAGGALLFSWRANGRLLSLPVAAGFAAGALMTAASFTIFMAGNGQHVETLLPVVALGPSWILLGLGLREPRDMPEAATTQTQRLAGA